ncbi:MAG: MGMT family protein [Planctomycetota bacterium]
MPERFYFHHVVYEADGIPIGIGACWQKHSLLALSLSPDREIAIEKCLKNQPMDNFCFRPFPVELEQDLQRALDGKKFDWRWQAKPLQGTDFQRRIWSCLQELSPGETISYRELATRVGSPGAARAAGTACSRNPIPLRIPCHRVVSSDGSLGGFTGDLRLKAWLLTQESSAEFQPGSLPL